MAVSLTSIKFEVDASDLTDRERMVIGWLSANPGAIVMNPNKTLDTVLSLKRFGLVDSEYVPAETGYGYTLTETGRTVAEAMKPSLVRACCDAAVWVPCWCVQSVACLKHGTRCYGSHD